MNLIEEAAKRLKELEQAGVRVPDKGPAPRAAAAQPRSLAGAREARREPALREAPPARGANFRNIDLARLHAAGLVTPDAPESKLLHELRVIKRPLILNAQGKTAGPVANGNLIMVTSSLPGEGKSFLSVNLAMSIAMEVDSRVLLVDADVVRPTIPKVLGLPPAPGLMDVITNPDLGVSDVMLKTNIERLSLILAGTPRRDSSELLASEAMHALVRELGERYPDRIIVFDSPPLLATTEARVLASYMGQVVLVVEAERTTHGTLESALATIENCPVVNTVLNKAPMSESGSYYGYYGYGR
jgi:receptor protein-tyrosine kinase